MDDTFRKTDRVLLPLRRLIQRTTHSEGSKLPSLRKLAREFSVSVWTVRRALRVLINEGLVEIRTGSGLYCKSTREANLPCPITLETKTKRKAEIVKDSISKEISSGNWKVGDVIPSLKTMRHRFETSPRTLNKALRILAKEGFIHRSRKSWVIGPANSRGKGSSKRVYAITGGTPSLSGRGARTIHSGFLLPFERELANCGTSFAGNLGPNDPRRPSTKSLAMGNALGFLFYGYSEGWARNQENALQVEKDMTWTSSLGVRVAAFNCTPILGRFPDFSFKPYKNVFPLGLDNQAIGRETGLFLSMMGHCRIAYFGYATDFWIAQRKEGLEQATKLPIDPLKEIVPFQTNLRKDAFRNPKGIDRQKLRRPMREIAEEISPKSRGIRDPQWPEIIGLVYRMVIQEDKQSEMQPLFKEALKDRSITAWAAADPGVALAAAGFLRKQGVSIPSDVSLISIDDSEEISIAGITACNIQRDRLGYLAAHCLLGDIPIKKDKRGLVVCPPRIIDRGSVRRI